MQLDMPTVDYVYWYFHNGYKTISIYRVDVFKCRLEIYYNGKWEKSEEGSPEALIFYHPEIRTLRQITKEQAEAYIGKEALVAKLLR